MRSVRFKRFFDILAALLIAIFALPVMTLVALAIGFNLGTPVLFRQIRPGVGGRPFKMIKFRTMKDAVGADGTPLPDSERLTALGRFLRATSLDELPELYNVLKGDMSLVGPRPLAMAYLPLYSTEQFRRHEMRPGITGLAQVSGRNSLTWQDRFRLDVEYIDKWSMGLDLKILLLTVRAIILRDGVREGGQAEVPSFNGKN